MRSRLLASAAMLTLAAGGLMVSAAGPASAACGHDTHPDEYGGGGIHFEDGGTIIRSGPHGSCARIGTGQPGEGIDAHCALLSEHTNFQVWVFVRDLDDGVSGWAHEDELRVEGGSVFVGDCVSGELIVVH
jgi:hypothetical protein